MALKRLLRPIPPPPRGPGQAISPDTVLLAHRSDADVLAYVDSTSLRIDENLIAQIRERIALAEQAAARSKTPGTTGTPEEVAISRS